MRRTLQIVLLALAPRIADAKVASFYLTDMVRAVENIVIGTVESVSADEKRTTNAEVRVHDVLKGPRVTQMEVDVTKTWACDVSEARKGEKVLLFVLPDKDTKRNRAYAFGRGLMPISTHEGDEYVSFWPEVWMKKIRMVEGGVAEDDRSRANLADMKAYIKQAVESAHSAPAESRREHPEAMSLQQALRVDAVGQYALANAWQGTWRITSQTGCYTNFAIAQSERTARFNRVVCYIDGTRQVYFFASPEKRSRVSLHRKVLPTDDAVLACKDRGEFACLVGVPEASVPGFRAIQLFARANKSTVNLVSIWYREPNENFPQGGCLIRRARTTPVEVVKKEP